MSELTRLPGLADVHVHLRVPGGEHKEDVRSGTAAALAGGFTTILAMPNTAPPIVTLADLRAAGRHAESEALCDVHYFAGASASAFPTSSFSHKERGPAFSPKYDVGGEPDDEWSALGREAVGLKIYMDQTYGPLRVNDLTSLMRYFRHWPHGKPIALHAEGTTIAIGLGLAAAFGRSIHICHVSRKAELSLIAEAKRRGLSVTCEVTPHHLFLSEEDLPRLGPLGDMRPTLASRADVDALWSHLGTTVDCIATDHAPHTLDEKHGPGSPPGVPGLETALPLMLTAVAEGRLDLDLLVALMATNPRRIYSLREQPDTWIEVDIGATWSIENAGLHTKCGWSPFAGMQVRGRVQRVQFRGAPAYMAGEIVPPQPSVR